MGVKYLTFNVLLYPKTEQKPVINLIHQNLLKKQFFNKKYTFYNLCPVCLDCNKMFLIKKKAGFQGIIKGYWSKKNF